MTPEEKGQIVANAKILKNDIESLIERINVEGDRRRINPFFARWLTRTLIHDRNRLVIAIDQTMFPPKTREYPEGRFDMLSRAYEAASFAMTYGHRLLMEELGEM